MVNLKSLHILRPHEWLILSGAVLLLGAVYALLIQPSLESLSDLPRLREEKTAVQEGLGRTQRKLHRIEQQMTEDKVLLAEMGGAPPPASKKDLQIASVTHLANQCNVKIKHYKPMGVVDHVDHRAFMVEFAAQGSFLNIHQLFERIESEIDFVDVTHFAVTADQASQRSTAPEKGGQTSICLATWSCRINGIRPSFAEPSTELASREP